MIEVTCVVCGATFQTKASHGKYCSEGCRRRAKLRKTSSEKRARPCVGCGELFMPKVPQQKACCYKCYNDFEKRKRKENAEKGMASCPVCGKKFKADGARIYCSQECKQKQKNIKRKETYKVTNVAAGQKRTCPICGRTFDTHGISKKYCSDECLRESKREKSRQYYQNKTHGTDKAPKETAHKKRNDDNLRHYHDCGKPTSDYRCPECRAKWQKKHGVTASNDNFAHAVYGVAAC